MRGQPQLGLRRFVATTASMRSLSGPFGPGRHRRLGENKMRYFRLLSTLWKCSRVEGFRTIAERRTRAGRDDNLAHPGDDPIGGAEVGRTLAPAIEDQQLMPHQHGLSDNRTEAARPC